MSESGMSRSRSRSHSQITVRKRSESPPRKSSYSKDRRSPSHDNRRKSPKHSYARSISRSPLPVKRSRRSRSRSYSPRRRSNDRRSNDRRSNDRRSNDRRRSNSRSRNARPGTRDNPVQSNVLGIFGLSVATTEQQINQIFSKYGPLERVNIVLDSKTGRSRGFCFVYFASPEDAKEAKNHCSGMEIDERKIRVDYSITLRAHTPTPGKYMGRTTRGERGFEHNGYRHQRERGDDYDHERPKPRHRERRSPSPYREKRRRRSRSRSYSPRERRYR